MQENNSTRDTPLDAYDLALTRVGEAINLLTVLAISTSSDSIVTPSPLVLSPALDGVTALLEQAKAAIRQMESCVVRQLRS